MDISTLVEVLVSTGVLTALSAFAQGWFHRRAERASVESTKVDSAKVVQGMAIDLLQPLHQELTLANQRADELNIKLNEVERNLDSIVTWAFTVKSILDANHIAYPNVPQVMLVRQN